MIIDENSELSDMTYGDYYVSIFEWSIIWLTFEIKYAIRLSDSDVVLGTLLIWMMEYLLFILGIIITENPNECSFAKDGWYRSSN